MYQADMHILTGISAHRTVHCWPGHTSQWQGQVGQNAVLNSKEQRLQLANCARLCFVAAEPCQGCSTRLPARHLAFASGT